VYQCGAAVKDGEGSIVVENEPMILVIGSDEFSSGESGIAGRTARGKDQRKQQHFSHIHKRFLGFHFRLLFAKIWLQFD
jgi:hypothetical protein